MSIFYEIEFAKYILPYPQIPFGHPTEPPKPIVKVPIEERVKVLQ